MSEHFWILQILCANLAGFFLGRAVEAWSQKKRMDEIVDRVLTEQLVRKGFRRKANGNWAPMDGEE